MHLIRVTDHSTAREFLHLPLQLNYSQRSAIRSQQKRIKDLVSRKVNPLTEGATECWILSNFRGQTIGRIMAILDQSGTEPKGYFALFECIDHQKAARLLLEECAQWLNHFGVKEMTGPLNFLSYHHGWLGEAEHEKHATFPMGVQAGFYPNLLKGLGFQAKVRKKLYRYHTLADAIPPQLRGVSTKESGIEFHIQEKGQLRKTAKELEQIIAASDSDIPRINAEEIMRWLRQIKEVSYHPVLCMAYREQEPIGVSIITSVPDVHSVTQNYNKYSFWQNLRGGHRLLLELFTCTHREVDREALSAAFLEEWEQYFEHKKHIRYDGLLLLQETADEASPLPGKPELVHNYYKFGYRFDQHALIGTFAKNHF